MDEIRNEQHLLRLYYDAEQRGIWESSTSIEADCEKLDDQVRAYAKKRNLDDSFVQNRSHF